MYVTTSAVRLDDYPDHDYIYSDDGNDDGDDNDADDDDDYDDGDDDDG